MHRKILCSAALFLFFSGIHFSQNPTIAVLEFVNKPNVQAEYRELVENAFSEAAKNQGRFKVLERKDLADILAERELQKSGEYVDATAAEQGKALGADYLIIGSLLEGGIINSQVNASGNYPAQRFAGIALTIDVRIISTATSEVLFSHQQKIVRRESWSGQSAEFNQPIEKLLPALAEKFMVCCRNYANSIFLETFPPTVQILEVEASGKKARKVTVGTTAKLKISQIIEVFEEELIEVDGETISRKIKIGELDVMEMQGEKLARCYVKDGNKEILAYFNEGKKIICQVKSWKLRGLFGQENDSFEFFR